MRAVHKSCAGAARITIFISRGRLGHTHTHTCVHATDGWHGIHPRSRRRRRHAAAPAESMHSPPVAPPSTVRARSDKVLAARRAYGVVSPGGRQDRVAGPPERTRIVVACAGGTPCGGAARHGTSSLHTCMPVGPWVPSIGGSCSP
jgi:hypothetical protein